MARPIRFWVRWIMAFIVMLIAPSICNYLLTKRNKGVIYYKQPCLMHSEPVSKSAVTVGALFGTLSTEKYPLGTLDARRSFFLMQALSAL